VRLRRRQFSCSPGPPLLLLLALLLPALPSCASRSFTIKTNPPGSDVYVDGTYVGRSPVTVPFVYGGEREILVHPPKVGTDTRKQYRPKRVIYDTTRDTHDLPVIDLFADITGVEDKQTTTVDLEESRLEELFRIDKDAWCAAIRARANTLRSRAREFQLGALPTERGRDPGPLDSRPETRSNRPVPDPVPESR
jgi:hypothetical protein